MKRKPFFVNYIVEDRCKSVTVEAFNTVDVFTRLYYDRRYAEAVIVTVTEGKVKRNTKRTKMVRRFKERLTMFSPRMSAILVAEEFAVTREEVERIITKGGITMKATGIARRIDDLGRIEIPKQVRQRFGIRKGDILEIYTDKDGTISFRKVPEEDGALLQAQNPALRVNCDRCGRPLLPGDKSYTAVGVNICEECNTKSNGTVSMEDILAKIEREAKERHIVRHCANCGAPVSTNKCYECGEEGKKMFEKLTHRSKYGIAYTKIATNKSNMVDVGECYTGRIIDSLAAYEDTGLTQEEVQALAKAKAEGRLVELPPDGQIYHIEEIKETGEHWIGNKPCQYIQRDGYYCGWGLAAICFPFSDIGKTAFLTREEAEKAIGGKP